MKKITSLVALSVLCIGSANAASINYSDFSDVSAFQLNGQTASVNPNSANALRLTDSTSQSGSAFLSNTISLSNQASFSSAFQFQITNPIGISDSDGQGADGLVFVIQTNANNVGGFGGGIGYQGINNSVGIEFDTWDNGAQDDYSGNHVGINLDGNINSVSQVDVSPRLNDGSIWSAWVDYNGVTDLLEVRASNNGIRSTNALLSYYVDLETILGTPDAFIGFTSGTGAAGGVHDILNFQFVDDFHPIGVAEPTSLAILSLGLLGFAGFRRRK